MYSVTYHLCNYSNCGAPGPEAPADSGIISLSSSVTWSVSWSSAHPPDPLLFTNRQTARYGRMRSLAWSEQVSEPHCDPINLYCVLTVTFCQPVCAQCACFMTVSRGWAAAVCRKCGQARGSARLQLANNQANVTLVSLLPVVSSHIHWAVTTAACCCKFIELA